MYYLNNGGGWNKTHEQAETTPRIVHKCKDIADRVQKFTKTLYDFMKGAKQCLIEQN